MKAEGPWVASNTSAGAGVNYSIGAAGDFQNVFNIEGAQGAVLATEPGQPSLTPSARTRRLLLLLLLLSLSAWIPHP